MPLPIVDFAGYESIPDQGKSQSPHTTVPLIILCIFVNFSTCQVILVVIFQFGEGQKCFDWRGGGHYHSRTEQTPAGRHSLGLLGDIIVR